MSGSGSFSNTPTITYTPLTGSAFIQGLATPLKPELVFVTIQNGLPADAILFTTIYSINGLRNQSASLAGITPADPDFHRVRQLMRSIQVSGEVRIYVREDQSQSCALRRPRVIATLPAGDEPTAFCFSSNNQKVYWINEWSHTVAVVDAATDTPLHLAAISSSRSVFRVSPTQELCRRHASQVTSAASARAAK